MNYVWLGEYLAGRVCVIDKQLGSCIHVPMVPSDAGVVLSVGGEGHQIVILENM